MSGILASDGQSVHLIDLLFLQKLPFAHESLYSNLSVFNVSAVFTASTYVIDEIVVLYLGE